MESQDNQDQDNHPKNNLQVLLGAFFTIITLIAVGYLMAFIMDGNIDKVTSYDMFCVPASLFKPEPIERSIYLTSVFLSPFLTLGFNFYIKRFLNKVALRTDLNVYCNAVSAFLILLFGILGWIGLDRVDYWYISNNFYYVHPLISVCIMAVLMVCLLKFNLGESKVNKNKIPLIILNILSGLFILLVFLINIFDMNSIIGEKSLVNFNHFDAVFYSMSQVFMGKAVLINFANQYGLYPHFLEPIFQIIGLNVLNFSIVMGFLAALCFGFIFLFFKKSIDNWLIGFLGFTSILYFSYFFGSSLPGPPDPYFQYVPIRFLFPTVLIYLSFCYFQNNSKKIYYSLHALCSLAYLWNTETGILVFFAWLITLIYVELFNSDYKTALKNIGKHIVIAGLSLAVVILSYYLYTYVRYGATPTFNFEYQKIFYTMGFFMLPMPKIHPWNLIAITYLLGLSYCARALLLKKENARVKTIFLLSILGIGIFSYYQGRSHDFGLVGVWYPAVILAVIFTDSLYKTIKTNKKDYINLTVFCFLIYFLSSSFFSLISSYDYNSNIINTAFAQMSSKEPNFIRDNVNLIKKHTKAGDKILILSYTSGAYFAETQTLSALDIPSFGEMFLKKDLTFVEQAIKETKVDKVFFDSTFSTMGTTEGHANVLAELEKNYRIKDSNKWMLYLIPK